MQLDMFRLAILIAILSSIWCGQSALAQSLPVDQTKAPSVDKSKLEQANGIVSLDYTKLKLNEGGSFDLLGVHYLQQLHDWLYLGLGVDGPLLEGNYGGFFIADVTLHTQKKFLTNWFVDGGISVGGGGGGSSIGRIKALSGSGRYTKKYLGLGYEIDGVQYGLNYSRVSMPGSPVNDSGFNFFIQKPISFWVGSFDDAGKWVTPADFNFREHDSVISFELNNLTQINPKGSYRGHIELVSPQFSQFISKNDYLYFAFDLGFSGLDWYNQIHGGIGRRVAISPDWNLYGQIGIGTGGWVTDTIDTGSGLLIYPKVKAEYLWSKDLGLSLSAGYLTAPKGSSRNITVGAAVNFNLSALERGGSNADSGSGLKLTGLRMDLYDKVLTGITYNNIKINNVNMAMVQLDYVVNSNFYIPFQVGAATNSFQGYAGYTEMFVGLGWQSHYTETNKFQGFAQLSIGLNDLGVNRKQDVGPLLNAAIGFNYGLSDRLALFGQLGKSVSIKQYTKSDPDHNFKANTFGLGLTYRFSLPMRESN